MAKNTKTDDDTAETVTEAKWADPVAHDPAQPAQDPAVPQDPAQPAQDPAVPTPPHIPGDGSPADPQAAAESTRARSVVTPNAPPPPSDILPSVEEQRALDEKAANEANAAAEEAQANKPDDGIHPESGVDARLHLALDLAKRALSFGLINDLSKAVLLLLDMHGTPDAKGSPIAVAAARGEAPTLL